jgi:hypothetical protein
MEANTQAITTSTVTKSRLLEYRKQNPVKFAVKFGDVDVDSMPDGSVLTRTVEVSGKVTNVVAKPTKASKPEVDGDESDEEELTEAKADKPKAKSNK